MNLNLYVRTLRLRCRAPGRRPRYTSPGPFHPVTLEDGQNGNTAVIALSIGLVTFSLATAGMLVCNMVGTRFGLC
jgi:hypothetical protein